MNKVLIINASVRKERSHSRKLTELFKDNWKKKNPNDQFTYREVGLEEIPPINEKWIASAFISPKERTNENQTGVELSNALIKEFKEHNVYVLGTPMYNWSIPSGLKSYIDQIMRINETWKFRSGKPDGDYVGLLENKKMFHPIKSRGYGLWREREKRAYEFPNNLLEICFRDYGNKGHFHNFFGQ